MNTEEVIDLAEDDDRIELLPHEQTLMLDTMNDDVLFITGRGIGIERLCLHHLHMYSDPKLLVLVLNTSSADEHFFLNKLKEMNPTCPPKLINSDVSIKQREAVYLDGGVQFITSRVLMVDLLTDRIPVQNVSGIVVYRAHEILRSFQESFILRLYREKKAGGFVKAFSDNPTVITSSGIGQLQRLFDKLYVKNVRLLPRFDSVIKETYDASPPKLCELEVDLPVQLRKVRMGLMDIIRTCVRELKQTVHSLEIEMEDDALSPSAALYPSKLELDLRRKTLLLTERQERILNDLGLLRALLRKVEDLDPFTAFRFVQKLRNNKDLIENNSGWLFTPTASKIFSGLENLCSTKSGEDSTPMVASPPKWDALKTALFEIKLNYLDSGMIIVCPSRDTVTNILDEKILILSPSEECCRQLLDVIKFGDKKFQWMLTKAMMNEKDPSKTPGREPASMSWWNSESIVLYDSQLNLKNDRKELVNKLQTEQKKSRKRGKQLPPAADSKKMKQSSLVKFGVVKYNERKEKVC
uniref:DNA repair endonuclease XPF n=1 Tax=Panagrolaimus superbus TaxID=310955 RepID=A0A914YBF0_9BILA